MTGFYLELVWATQHDPTSIH